MRIKKDSGKVVSKHSSLSKCQAAIRAASAGEASKMKNEFSITGMIGKDTKCEDLISALEEADKDKPFVVKINSQGGNLLEAINMFNVLMDYEGKVHTYNESLASSAAGVLLLAGDKISARANALTMLHGPRLTKPFKGTAEEVKSVSDALEAAKAQMAETIKARTGKSAESVGRILSKDTWYTAKKAKAEGIVDEIIEIEPRRINLVAIDNLPDDLVAEIDLYNQGVDIMSLKDLCAAFDIDIQDVSDDDIEAKLSDYVEGLQNSVETLKKDLDEAKKLIPKPKAEFPKVVTEIVCNSRVKEVDSLVASGKVTAAVAKDLKKEFCSADKVASCFDDEGAVIDAFDATIAALDKNETVVTFGGKHTRQPIGSSLADNDNPLLKDADKRRKEKS